MQEATVSLWSVLTRECKVHMTRLAAILATLVNIESWVQRVESSQYYTAQICNIRRRR